MPSPPAAVGLPFPSRCHRATGFTRSVLNEAAPYIIRPQGRARCPSAPPRKECRELLEILSFPRIPCIPRIPRFLFFQLSAFCLQPPRAAVPHYHPLQRPGLQPL